MNFHIITLFPQSFDSYLGESILSRAILDNKIKVKFYNPRDFAENAFRRIDQKPYSGGPGMVIEALPVIKAVEKALTYTKIKNKKSDLKSKNKNIKAKNVKIIWLSPCGKMFDTEYAKKTVAKCTHIIIVCGRYDGIDARVKKVFQKQYAVEDVSVGSYVLTGGELPAMIIIDCMSRQVEGVLGNFNSLEESRVASSEVYTRPEILEYKGKKYRVPKVLLSGDHKKIEAWKEKHT